MIAAWLCVVVVALALARACWQVQAAVSQLYLDLLRWQANPTQHDVDAVLAHIEEASHGKA